MVSEREKFELTEADRARILSLAKDLPAVWSAATTTDADRKNLLRMVVREVTLSPVDVPRRMTRVQVLWETGATSDFTVPRKDKYVALVTPPESLALLQKLFAANKTDSEIAKALNRRHLKTGRDQPWDIAAVRRVRYNHGLYRESRRARRAPDRRADGLYSVHAVAARMHVPPSVVRYWARTGVLEPVERGGPGHPHWFVLDPATLSRLKEARAKCHVLPPPTEEAEGTRSPRRRPLVKRRPGRPPAGRRPVRPR